MKTNNRHDLAPPPRTRALARPRMWGKRYPLEDGVELLEEGNVDVGLVLRRRRQEWEVGRIVG